MNSDIILPRRGEFIVRAKFSPLAKRTWTHNHFYALSGSRYVRKVSFIKSCEPERLMVILMIHKYRSNGMNIVLDINSGAVHIVDDVVFDILDSDILDIIDFKLLGQNIHTKYCEQDIKLAFNEIKQLQRDGLLYSEDIYDCIADKLHKASVVKALCLHVSHDCNLSCEYCFANKGVFAGGRQLMDIDIGRRAIDFVIKNSGKRRNIEIDFFGGEPLMNFDVVKGVVEYAKSQQDKLGKHFRFTITTNGLLLDGEKGKYINENMDNIVLSLDGTKKTNDEMRRTLSGKGSYDIILPKFKEFVKTRQGKDYYVRGTFTAKNIDFLNDVEHLAAEGFKNLSVEPVVAPESASYAITSEHLPRIFDEYDKLTTNYIKNKKSENSYSFFHFMIDLEQGPCIIKRLSGCGAGHEYLAVTPEGDIYPCHQFVGNKEFLMGNVSDGEVDTKIKSYFENSNVLAKEDCKACWAKFYCSGGCSANAYSFNKDINIPYLFGCELQKKRIECAITVQAAVNSE